MSDNNKDETPPAPKEPARDVERAPSSSSSSSSKLKESLRTAVQATNRALASAEETVSGIRDRVAPAVDRASAQAASAAAAAAELYDHRKEYGPVLIGGTALTAGALVTLRRGGKLPGLVAATLASGAAYGVVYGLDGLEIPTYGGGTDSSGKKEE